MLLQLNLEVTWQMNQSCVVECPVNCQLSDWSDWSTCSHTCGLKGETETSTSSRWSSLWWWTFQSSFIVNGPTGQESVQNRWINLVLLS